MEGTSIALPAVGTLVARTATSGRRVPIQVPTPGACTSTAPSSTRRSTAIRRAVFRFVASPAKITIREGQTTLLTKVIRNFRNFRNFQNHQDYQKSQHSQGPQTDNRINNLLHQFPFSLPYGGYINRTTGDWYNRGTNGVFWSEGANSATNARYLYFGGVGVWPEDNHYKTNGFPVRCVASQVSTKTNSNCYFKIKAISIPKALKPTTASTTFSTSFPSRYRMEGASLALPAVGAVVARTATSGRRVPVQVPVPRTCTSTAPTSAQRTTPIRRTVFQFVASPTLIQY